MSEISCPDAYSENRTCSPTVAFHEDSRDGLRDVILEAEKKLKCGEILLTSNRILSFSCNFCEKKERCVDKFLRHILKQHLMLTEAEAQALLQETTERNPIEVAEEHLDCETSEAELTAIQEHGYFSPFNQPSENDRLSDGKGFFGSDTQDYLASSDEMTEYLNDHVEEIMDNNKTPNVTEKDKLLPHKVQVLPDPTSKNTKGASEVNQKKETEMKNVKKNPLSQIRTRSNRKSLYKRKKHECKICKNVFGRNPTLSAHMKTHLPDRPYPCEHCDAWFKDKSNLKVHTYRHLGIKPYTCSECKKSFTSSTELKQHVRCHTGERTFVCEECGLSYPTLAYLRIHLRLHYNIRPYNCETCGKQFHDIKRLRSHQVSHSSERPHACGTCNATFSRRRALIQHAKLHSDVKEYVCKICGKQFAQSAGLWGHMKSKHGTVEVKVQTNLHTES